MMLIKAWAAAEEWGPKAGRSDGGSYKNFDANGGLIHQNLRIVSQTQGHIWPSPLMRPL